MKASVLMAGILTNVTVGMSGMVAIAIGDPTVDADDNSFVTSVNDANFGDSGTSVGAADPIGTYHEEPACVGVCTGDRTCPDGTFKIHSWLEGSDGEVLWQSYWCPSETPAPAVTDDLVATAFRRIPLPPSTFSIQPPGGRTLVNFDTNFFTEQQDLDRTVRLLGQRVDLRITVHSYAWQFGDGESVTTREPGAPYPKLLITHNYREKGAYRPRMDTTWVADYRVGGGAWQPVPGSVTIEGTPAALRAVEARPTLVGYEG